jgi:Subtilisin inhibitor-like
VRALLAPAVLGLAFACGASAAGTPQTSLRISVWLEGRTSGEARVWRLHCVPSSGTHPRAASACARLAALDDPFRPVPPDAICTQQYGGPSEALVTGRFRGRRIWARFNRRDGCHISRWQKHAFLFPVRPASP